MDMDTTIVTNTNNMIDVHAHILHDVDDGAKSLSQAIEMIKLEMEQGVKTIVLTPHVQSRVTQATREEHLSKFKELLFEVNRLNLDIHLILGSEIFYRAHLRPNYKELTFGSSKCLLLEFSTMIDTPIEEITYNMKTLGYIPIIAHVERYEYLKFEDLIRIKDAGGYLQVNTNAVLGLDQKIKKGLVPKMLKHGLVDIISTDSHNLDHKKPNMKDCYTFLSKQLSKDYLDSLFGGKMKELLHVE